MSDKTRPFAAPGAGGRGAGILFTILFSLSTHAAFAQAAGDAPEPDEQVIVTAPKPTKRLLAEIGEATEDFYMRWNAWLNEHDKEFQVICDSEAPRGSRIIHRVCRTRYQLAAMAKQSQAAIAGSTYDPAPDLTEHGHAMAALMLDAVNEDPALRDAMEALTSLKAEYARRFDDDGRKDPDD